MTLVKTCHKPNNLFKVKTMVSYIQQNNFPKIKQTTTDQQQSENFMLVHTSKNSIEDTILKTSLKLEYFLYLLILVGKIKVNSKTYDLKLTVFLKKKNQSSA